MTPETRSAGLTATPTATTSHEHPCDHHTETSGACGTKTSRRYLTGWRCPEHTPAHLAGHPETQPDPTRTLAGLRQAAGLTPGGYTPAGQTIVDARAVASGKRRSNPTNYRAAQTETGARP